MVYFPSQNYTYKNRSVTQACPGRDCLLCQTAAVPEHWGCGHFDHKTFRRQPLDVCVVVICRFNTVLRFLFILSAGDVDCSFPASFSFLWLWFLVIWSIGQLVGMDCSFPASFAFPLWFLGVWFNSQFIHRLLCCVVLHWMTVTRKQAC